MYVFNCFEAFCKLQSLVVFVFVCIETVERIALPLLGYLILFPRNSLRPTNQAHPTKAEAESRHGQSTAQNSAPWTDSHAGHSQLPGFTGPVCAGRALTEQTAAAVTVRSFVCSFKLSASVWWRMVGRQCPRPSSSNECNKVCCLSHLSKQGISCKHIINMAHN